MNIIVIVSTALIAAVLSLVLKQYKPEYSLFISIAAGIMIFLAVAAVIQPIMDYISELISDAGLSGVYAEALIKALAVCYITQLACDCCKDAGENAIAGKLQLAGRVAILIISLPMFKSITDIVTGLIDN
ncbi:MAG: stage III sporulation AC/AD family protein [Firmicutes bacterium]|nr:stage III sporulation AC/AD family protein [[Eubacterium] siraeum]MCM1487392.1 stage III sporulation AC/AD family protein [Bacillota bacterium]